MLVTITEKYSNGTYVKAASTFVGDEEFILGAIMCSGPIFADRLNQFEEGLNRSSVFDIPVDFEQRRRFVLSLPTVR